MMAIPLTDGSVAPSGSTGKGRIVSIEGDPQSPISEGHLCPKGAATFQLVTGTAFGAHAGSTRLAHCRHLGHGRFNHGDGRGISGRHLGLHRLCR